MQNYIEALEMAATNHPHEIAYTFLEDNTLNEINITYSELIHKAKNIAGQLQEKLQPGDRVILLYPPGIELIAAFLGCLYAGVIAILVHPPQTKELAKRVYLITKATQVTHYLTTAEQKIQYDDLYSLTTLNQNAENPQPSIKEINTLNWLITDQIETTSLTYKLIAVEPKSIAFLQFTSGSTGDPKGVMVSHENILFNLNAVIELGAMDRKARILSWVPPYHNLGLIFGILLPLYLRCRSWLMSPTTFLKKPIIWLQSMSKYAITCSAGPNFSYELCLQRISEAEKANLNLSSLRTLVNAGEAVRASTLNDFFNSFKSQGLRRESLFIGYGLAESTLIVSGSIVDQGPVIKPVKASALTFNQVIYTTEQDTDVKLLPSIGKVASGYEVIIVDPETNKCLDTDEIGEIWIKGPCVTQGYWLQPEATSTVFQAYTSDGFGPFLRSGDLGFIKNDQIFLTGRIKELIIIHGLNYYPQDIELTVEKSHSLLCPGSNIAFSLDKDEKEYLVIMSEVNSRFQTSDSSAVIAAIQSTITLHHRVNPDIILLLPEKTIQKTTSGKLCRMRMRDLFKENKLPVLTAWPDTDSARKEA